MIHDKQLHKALAMPVGYDGNGSYFVWKPGVRPARLYRRTTAFRKLTTIRIAIITAFLLIMVGFFAAIWLAQTSALKGIGLAFATAVFGCMLWIRIIEDGGGYNNLVCQLHRSSLRLIPRTELYWPHSALETNLVRSLEAVQSSQAVATDIVSHERVSELHKSVWMLLTSHQVTEGDVAELEQAATEIREIDRIIAERQSDDNYNGRAGKALQDQSKEITDQLRLFREFLETERDD